MSLFLALMLLQVWQSRIIIIEIEVLKALQVTSQFNQLVNLITEKNTFAILQLQ
jgi:hypothetical protein